MAGLMLLVASSSQATNVLTDAPNRPMSEGMRWHGFELSPMLSLPLPVAGASRDRLGLSTGVRFTVKTERSGGFGAGIAYHYWPVSAEMKRAFDSRLRTDTWNILRTGEGSWELDVVQFGFHVQHLVPGSNPTRPWTRVGVGLYRVDPNISGYTGEAGLFTLVAGPLRTTIHLGGSLAMGASLFSARWARIGLDADYHYVSAGGLYGSDLHVFTLGTHARFGK